MVDKNSPSVLVRVWLLGEFQVERRKADDTWEAVAAGEWGTNSYPRSVLKWLCCAPKRRALREHILEQLWPDTSFKLAEINLNNATSKLRRILQHPHVLHTFGPHTHSGYELAGQAILWTDIDACEHLMTEAEHMGRRSQETLECLQRACQFFERGGCLEGDSAEWCTAVQSRLAETRHCCWIWLAEAYEKQELFWNARGLYCKLLEANPHDEDALCRFMVLLHRQGMTPQVLERYGQMKQLLKEEGRSLSPTTRHLAEKLAHESPPIELYLPPGVSSPLVRAQESPSLPAVTQGILRAGQEDSESGGQNMDKLRRQLIQFGITGTTIITPISDGYYAEVLERFLRALKRPSNIDTTTLNYLHQHVMTYWQERAASTFASCDLLTYAIEHFQRLTYLLEGSLLPGIRTHLCLTASRSALLIGVLLYDMGNYEQARNFQKIALHAAQEANHSTLQAICWAWISFTWTYSKHMQAALACIQEARRLAAKSTGISVQTWLAAIEAEIQASLHNSDACFYALEEAEKVKGVQAPHEDYFLFHFDSSLLEGYKGVCFQKLYHPEKAQTNAFLVKSQEVLEEAMTLLGPAKSNQANYLIDLAGTLTLQGEIEAACNYALQTVSGLLQTKSLTRFRRLADLRQTLEPWKETQYVQELDVQIARLPFL